ncbi:leukocyte surface antigen CD47 [Egretta garzetta]|uniref:leukocyte surface antigen CD47 n=1 Tax=Egretta garzetta TaxID=188379 RepID=UPI00163B726C|nr:leukocyte surface antigen CD47 [Egretta garzetta]
MSRRSGRPQLILSPSWPKAASRSTGASDSVGTSQSAQVSLQMAHKNASVSRSKKKELTDSFANALWCLRKNKVLPITGLLHCDCWAGVVSMSITIHTTHVKSQICRGQTPQIFVCVLLLVPLCSLLVVSPAPCWWSSSCSAQLMFSATDVLEVTKCNKTVILPCYVTNLKENNSSVMFVTWKKQRKTIFSFDGEKQQFVRDPAVPSANLLSQKDLPKGVASLILNSAEADAGNYSCEVTESNREGETTVELRKPSVVSCDEESTPTPKEKCGSWFLLMERAIIIVLLFLVIIFCSAQLSVIALKYGTLPQKKMGIVVAGITITLAAVVGTVLFVQDGYNVQNQAGLGLIVVPALILVPLQYFMFGYVFDSLPQATFVLIGLQILGYIIAVIGFALCVSACPPLHGSVVIAGLAIMAIANLLSLAYVFIMGSSMKDHPRPGKAVEEPLNELKSDVVCEKYTVVDTPWP